MSRGSDRGYVKRDWIPEKSVQSFLTLLKAIEAKTGSHNSACVYCGIQMANVQKIISGKERMTAFTAKRIADGYKRLKAESCNTSPTISTISAKKCLTGVTAWAK